MDISELGLFVIYNNLCDHIALSSKHVKELLYTKFTKFYMLKMFTEIVLFTYLSAMLFKNIITMLFCKL